MNELNEATEKQKPFDVKVVDKRFKESEIMPASQTDLVMTAIQKGFQPEFIEKMMALQERFEANEARRAYVSAMARFKASPLKIEKDKKVEFQAGGRTTKYSHADLATASEKINKALSNEGLSSGWKTDQQNGNITVTCTITHELGHSENTSLTAGPDTSGSKNAIQAIGSTIAYLERYTLLALTGLAAHGMDDDAQGEVEYITKDMQTEIHDLIKSTKANKAKVLEYLKAESVEKILLSEYGKAKVAFEAKGKSTREPGQEG